MRFLIKFLLQCRVLSSAFAKALYSMLCLEVHLESILSLQADQIHNLGEHIGTKLAKAEEIGAQGNVEESLKLMQEVEDLKKKKATAEVKLLNPLGKKTLRLLFMF